MQYCQEKMSNVEDRRYIYRQRGRELIMIAIQGLLEQRERDIIPAPDYPLWTQLLTWLGEPGTLHVRRGIRLVPDLEDIQKESYPKHQGYSHY